MNKWKREKGLNEESHPKRAFNRAIFQVVLKMRVQVLFTASVWKIFSANEHLISRVIQVKNEDERTKKWRTKSHMGLDKSIRETSVSWNWQKETLQWFYIETIQSDGSTFFPFNQTFSCLHTFSNVPPIWKGSMSLPTEAPLSQQETHRKGVSFNCLPRQSES